MKISIETILGAARKVYNQQKSGDTVGKKKKDIGPDTVEIENKVISRLRSIQGEIKDLQISLTKNQLIDQGIERLDRDLARGSAERDKILDEVRFENKKVLHDFVGDSISNEILNAKKSRVENLMGQDISKLRSLEVEVENITASNLSYSAKVEDILKNVESLFTKGDAGSVESFSRLKADAVMRLIR